MHELTLKEIQKKWHGTRRSYAIGFLLSLFLTALSFSLALAQPPLLIFALIGLAVVQAIVQLLFFLHVGQEEAKPRWASLALCFTVLILLIIVIGSLWIMHDLNARMMPGMEGM